MSEQDAFGPNLRRIRIQRGVSLEQIALATKVSAALWAGLERNDLSRWPTGIYARGFDVCHAEVHHGLPWSRISDHAALSVELELR